MAVTSGKSETYTVIDFYNKAEKEYFLSIARYKWEFLRRNKNYIEDFNKKCTPIKKFKDILGSKVQKKKKHNSKLVHHQVLVVVSTNIT